MYNCYLLPILVLHGKKRLLIHNFSCFLPIFASIWYTVEIKTQFKLNSQNSLDFASKNAKENRLSSILNTVVNFQMININITNIKLAKQNSCGRIYRVSKKKTDAFHIQISKLIAGTCLFPCLQPI